MYIQTNHKFFPASPCWRGFTGGRLRDFAFALVCFSWLAFSPAAVAQQAHLLFGSTDPIGSSDDTYGWMANYSHALGKQFAWSVGYLNEGHLVDHRRDGFVAQLWARTSAFDGRLSLSAGVGPYLYFDTTRESSAIGYADRHGVGAVFSLAAAWNVAGPWNLELRANRVATSSFDTTVLLAGIGYRLGDTTAKSSFVADDRTSARKANEIAIYAGMNIQNSLESERDSAQAVEYRRIISPHLQWTLGLLNEGPAGRVERHGVMSQLWATNSFFNDRFTLGVGAGPYYVKNRRCSIDCSNWLGIVSIGASYRVSPAWTLRTVFNRVVTSSDTDSDVVLIGGGYSW